MTFNLPDDGTGYLPGFTALIGDPCAWLIAPPSPHTEGWIDRRTPSQQVPRTAAGELYRALPVLAQKMAERLIEIPESIPPGGDWSNIARLIDENLFNVSYQDFARGDPLQNLEQLLQKPLLLDYPAGEPAESFPVSDIYGRLSGTIPLPYKWIHGRAVPAAPVLLRAMALSNPWQPSPFVPCYTDVNQLPAFLQYVDGAGFSLSRKTVDDLNFSVRSLIAEGGGQHGGWGWSSDLIPPFLASSYRWIGGELSSANRRARLMDDIKGVFFVLSVIGVGMAAQTVLTQGLNTVNGLKLLTAIDRIPGVDFGAASDILRVLSKAGDYGALAQSAAETATGGGAMWDDWAGDWIGGSAPVDYGIIPDFSGWNFGDLLSNVTNQATDLFGRFDLQSFVTDLAKTYVQYDLSRRMLEQQGQRPPPPPVQPGQVRTLPDGSTARTNPDGSVTVVSPGGQTRTVMPSGQVVAGAPSPSLVPGVPNVLLFGGAAALAAVLLLRK